MRTLFRKWMTFYFVMLSIVACSENNIVEVIPEPQPEQELVEFTISASDDAENASMKSTRTYLDALGKVYWHQTDKLNVYEVTSQNAFVMNQTSSTTLSADKEGVANRIADFTVSLPRNDAQDLTYYASLGGCTMSKVAAEGVEMDLNLSATQTPAETSFDPATDLLVSVPVGPRSQPIAESVRFAFNRINAFGQMTIKGIDAGETLTSISFSTTTENIAGAATYNTSTQALTKSTTIEAKKIVLDAKNLKVANDGSCLVYFSLYPSSLKNYTLTVATTNQTSGKSYTYTKTVDRSTRPLEFMSCIRTKWGVTMKPENKSENVAETYQLVKDFKTVKAGDEVVLVGLKNSTSTYYALGAQNAGNYREAVAVTIDATAETCKLAQGVAVLTVETGSVANSLAFKDGANYLAYTKTSGKNNNLWTTTINDQQAAWVINVGAEANQAKIQSQLNTGRFLQFNQATPRFAGYTGTQENVFIYRKTAGSGSVEGFQPLVAPVPQSKEVSDTSITVGWTAVENADNYTVTLKNGTEVVATQNNVKKATAQDTEVTVTFNDLIPSTEYTIEVVANPALGSTEFSQSEIGSVKVVTIAESAKSDFRLVTTASGLTDGEYIMVAKANNQYYAMPTPAVNGKLVGVSVKVNTDGKSIAGSEATDKVWTLKKTGNTCSLYDGTNYLGHQSKTSFSQEANVYNWNIVDETAQEPLHLQSSVETTRGLLFHIETFNDFGAYATSNIGAKNYANVLFFRRDAGSVTPKTPLATPKLTVGAVTKHSVEITWNKDPLVYQYLVTVTKVATGDVVVGPNLAYDSATYGGLKTTNLEADTEYRFDVVATPQQSDTAHENSAVASVNQKTEPKGGEVTPTPSSDFVQVKTLQELGNGGEVVLVSHYATGAKPYNALPATSLSAGTHQGTEITPNTSVTPNTIAASAAQGHIWTLAKTTSGGYTLSFDKNGTKTYLAKASKSTHIVTQTTEHEWTISADATYGLMIVDATSNRHLGAASGNTGKIGAYNVGEAKTYTPVLVFLRQSGSVNPAEPTVTPLATPNVQTSVEGTTITVSWQAITGAKDYTVTCGTQTKTVSATSATFQGKENQTYQVSVVAHPSDTAKNSDSERGTASVTVGGTTPTPTPPTPSKELPTYFSSHTGWPELPSVQGFPENSNRYYYFHHDFASGTPSVKTNDMRNFSFCYDNKYYCSRWVAWPMTAEHVAPATRKDSWHVDSEFAAKYAGMKQPAVNEGSYADGIHSRGHLMASADRKIDTKSTTIATNVAPQQQNGHNAGVWSSLEDAVRNMIPQGDTLFVVTGVHFDETNYTIKYVNDKLGLSCGIPTHFYKVVLRKKPGIHKPAYKCSVSELETTAYWVEHDYKGTTWGTYDTYRTTVADVEQKTGLKFFVNVPNAPKTQNTVLQ